jgi:HTH-type transcriptional regulator / antitoxin HipB
MTICAIAHTGARYGYRGQTPSNNMRDRAYYIWRTVDSKGKLRVMHDRANRSVTWAEAIRRRRLELGLHQDELAALAGVSIRFVHTLEQGKPTLRLDKILAVLGQLGLDLVVEPGTGTIRYGEV